MKFHKKIIAGAGLLLLASLSLANIKVVDTATNLGTTVASRVPAAVLEVVGKTNGSGTILPSFLVRDSATSAALFQISSTCSASLAGAMRFAASEGGIRYCDGTNWVGTTPPGTVAFFATSVASSAASGTVQTGSCPAGWLAANGDVASQVTYPALYAAIGTAFASGTVASDSFTLPDLRGEFIRGWDNGRGVDSSRVFASFQANQVLAHKHLIPWGEYITGPKAPPWGTYSKGEALQGSGSTDFDNGWYYTNEGTDYNGTATNPAGYVGAENRPRNVALMACIKY